MATSHACLAPGRTAKLQIRLSAFNTLIHAHGKTRSLQMYHTKRHPRNGVQGQTTHQAVSRRPALQTQRAGGGTIDARKPSVVSATSCPQQTAVGQTEFVMTTVRHHLVAGGRTVEGEALAAVKGG